MFTLATPASLTTFTIRSFTPDMLTGYITRNGQMVQEFGAAGEDVAMVIQALNAMNGIAFDGGSGLSKTPAAWAEQLAALGYTGAYLMRPTFEGAAYPSVAVFDALPNLKNANPFTPVRDSAEWAAYCAINNKPLN